MSWQEIESGKNRQVNKQKLILWSYYDQQPFFRFLLDRTRLWRPSDELRRLPRFSSFFFSSAHSASNSRNTDADTTTSCVFAVGLQCGTLKQWGAKAWRQWPLQNDMFDHVCILCRAPDWYKRIRKTFSEFKAWQWFCQRVFGVDTVRRIDIMETLWLSAQTCVTTFLYCSKHKKSSCQICFKQF